MPLTADCNKDFAGISPWEIRGKGALRMSEETAKDDAMRSGHGVKGTHVALAVAFVAATDAQAFEGQDGVDQIFSHRSPA